MLCQPRGTHLAAQRGAEPVVQSQEAVGADHAHRHPHHAHLHLLLRLQVDLGESLAGSAPAPRCHSPAPWAGQKGVGAPLGRVVLQAGQPVGQLSVLAGGTPQHP